MDETAGPGAASRSGPVVETAAGRLRGSLESGLMVFRGVPYAAPPVGDLRWRATQPHPGWTGVRDAVEHGPISPQPKRLPHDAVLGTRGRSHARVDEDCLNLAVWTPAADGARRPVLVWIHGGGNVTGAGSWDVYSCEGFARHGDMVGVSINYRLGPFGYLFIDEEDGSGRGNFWLDDMLAALTWVRDNIASFGGDPDNVTVAGQSGGAISILWMMGMPAGRRLFKRAILQSTPLGFGARGVEESRNVRRRYFQALGVATVEQARGLPAEELVKPIGELTRSVSGWGLFVPAFWNVLDGQTIKHQPLEGLIKAEATQVDVLMGWTREEQAFFYAPDESMRAASREQVIERARLPFGDAAPEAYAEYARARPGGLPIEILGDIASDERYRIGSVQLAELLAAQGRPAYVYQLDWQSPAFGGLLGAPHCLELPFVFNNFEAWSDAGMLTGTDTPRRQALADAIHATWIRFIREGEPNHGGLPPWAPYAGERRTTMRLDAMPQPVGDLMGYWRDTWEKFGGRQR